MPEKKRTVNTPVSQEVRLKIKINAAQKGQSMQEYVEEILKKEWQKTADH